ncbi:hypothetical protein BBO_00736 [Beauveria brongniartii RCEF 3172]|uniref:Uncharacterized protein n=1 Tax=Beauveria brongniartii RCEF 3172 TaxID=1081107 RepID=A0A167JUR9_9HYPO|nr:hypothetical protein BBO_00736 [Beauveria brongniartii RCEF 3172]
MAKGRAAQAYKYSFAQDRMCPAADRAGADSFAAGGHESGDMDLLACCGESQSGRSQARWALSPPSSSRLSATLSFPASPAAPSKNLGLIGMNYFLANYVLPGSGSCPGNLNYSLDILSALMEDTELVQEAIRAMGELEFQDSP